VEDVDQPHSIWMQTLAELGLVGLLLLCAFVAGVLWGAVRMRTGARHSPLRRSLLTAGLGAFGAWLVQASVDWMALLPGLTGAAVLAASVLVWQRPAPAPAREAAETDPRHTPRRAVAAAGLAAVLVVLIVAGASLSRQGLAQLYRERAQNELARDPAAALADANRSLSIDSDAVTSYYAKAAALARYDQAAAAQTALQRALVLEPRNFVTWALLGDISVRLSDPEAARADYAHAHALNPRDAGLAALAAPRRAGRTGA
jgi:tetratricopeptide (TPR) repeat protein